MVDSEPVRRRPAVACSLCRSRKIRCDREVPCGNCEKRRDQNCNYDRELSRRRPQPRNNSNTTQHRSPDSSHVQSSNNSIVGDAPSTLLPSSTNAPIIRSAESTSQTARTPRREAEHVTAPHLGLSASSHIETTTSQIAGTFSVHYEGQSGGYPCGVSRGFTHKNRHFGQSHWINGVAMIRGTIELMEPAICRDTSEVFSSIQRCKALARMIKSRRASLGSPSSRQDLPARGISDKLVDCYLRTTETIYRVLHVPSFKKDYEEVWSPDRTPDVSFLILVKLVLAIGAATYDEHFSLRSEAVRWTHEAHSWLSDRESKHQLSIQSLQINILMLLAREASGVSYDMVWIATGTLLRTAVYMGLHRDPDHLPKMTLFAAEMRRRLWNTILEINLQSSIISGGSPFISLEDFDTKPPGNFDDEELMSERLEPPSEDKYTQMSIAIALRKLVAVRLLIIKSLNKIGSYDTYKEMLRLDAELRVLYKNLCRQVHGFKVSNGGRPTHFELCAVDVIIQRYFLALHVPFFGPAIHEAVYSYSRNVTIETSLRIWCRAYPSSTIVHLPLHENPGLSGQNDFVRYTACASGFFRVTAMQAILLMSLDVRNQLQGEMCLGPVPIRQDLLYALGDAKTWCLQCMKAGETNMKGFLLICLVAAHIEGLRQDSSENDLPALLVNAAKEAGKESLPILETLLSQSQIDGSTNQTRHLGLSTTDAIMDDWESPNSQPLLDFSSMGITNWIFDDDFVTEPCFNDI